MDKLNYVSYYGVIMPKQWPQKIRTAQKLTHYTIAGQSYPRIPYDKTGQPCHDCRITAGKLHVPGCDMERCPACGRQAISCGCAVTTANAQIPQGT